MIPKPLPDHAQDSVHGLTTRSLHDLHEAIRSQLEAEDALPDGAPKESAVREHADFRAQAEAIEGEFRARGEDFTPIDWNSH